ncbi:MAG: sigma-54-dependent Fis family transcriptional regulator [Pirellulales bacterium]|nr:sigma-54-dependent Fis family transcriptional regulator [Pirellulales bacterium]
MTLQRVRATALARLLNSAERPIYVLDDESTIVFCNQLLLTTIGPAAIDLLGRRCRYHDGNELTGADAVAAGLCPPPRVMSGQPATGSVSWVGEDGKLHQRWARFIPLCDGVCSVGDERTAEIEDVVAVVGLIDAADIPTNDISAVGDSGWLDTPQPIVAEAADLHRRVNEFRHSTAARYRVDRLIGNSTAIRRARRQVVLAVTSRASVLLVGQPGTGRQHVAKTIHYAADDTLGHAVSDIGNIREKETVGPLIPLDCSILGSDLIRSTFVALKGSSASYSKRCGTLLLNEADELPQEVQAELAAIISQPNFSTRLIATTRQPLDELVAEGKFREDLAALLSTIVVELPPLARRLEDLPLLVQMFVERENARDTKQIGGLTTEAMDLLDGYDWPGNLDELALVITEAHKNAESDTIRADDLPKIIHLAANVTARTRRPEETIVLDEYMAQIERELLQRAMWRSKGNKAKAARMLGLNRPRLYRRLIQLGLEKAPDKSDQPEEIDFQEDDEEIEDRG